MFTLLKVHDDVPAFASMESFAREVSLPQHLGWYKNPPGTVAESIHQARRGAARRSGATASSYTCPMHPEVVRGEPGKCPKCGMNLVPKAAEPKAVRGAGSHSGH